jgi:hypothetical protein
MVIDYRRPWIPDYQKAIIDSPARYTVTEAATKIGKTASHIIWAFEQALQIPPNCAVWWVAPVYQQAEIAFRRMRNQVTQSNFFKVNETKLRLTLPTGSVIEFKSADKPDNLYGDDVYAAVFDEFTRAKEDAWVALRTTLTATNGRCKFIGNVRGKKNWGYRIGVKARSGDDNYQYFKITAYDAVKAGILSQKEIDQAQKDLPENAFKQLYLAESLDDGANPFGVQYIQRQISSISSEEPVYFGVDLAKSVDWTVVTGLDSHGQICVFERWQSDWSQTRQRIAAIVGSNRGYIDSTGVGDPIAEDLMRECSGLEAFHFSSRSKQQIMEGLAKSVQMGEVSILPGVMQDEMESFEFGYTASGVRYSAPDGMHDDCVCSLALANHSYKTNTFTTSIRIGGW